MKRLSTQGILRKIRLRMIKDNWKQFLSIVAIGAIAVTLFVGLLTNAESFSNRVNTMYEGGNLADIWTTTRLYNPEDLAIVKEAVGEDATVESRLYLPAQAGSHAIYAIVSPQSIRESDKNGLSISKPYEMLAENETQKNDPTDYVIIDKALSTLDTDKNTGSGVIVQYKLDGLLAMEFDFSSYVDIETLSAFFDDYLQEGKSNPFVGGRITLEYTVTGIMTHPENITKASYNASSILISDKAFQRSIVSFLEKHYTEKGVSVFLDGLALLGFGDTADPNPAYRNDFSRPNQYLVSLKEHNAKKTAEIRERIEKAFAEAYAPESNNLMLVTDRSMMPFTLALEEDVKQARSFTFLFPMVFFVVGVLVILTTISQLIVKERGQIGTMKALGVSKFGVLYHYVSLTLMLVGVGLLIGVIVGPLLIPAIMDKKYAIIYTLPALKFTFPVLWIVLTAVAFLTVSGLVAYLISRKEVSLNPVESMRPLPPKMKARKEEGSKALKARLLSIKMAFRNIRFNLIKSIMVIVGVLGCTALLVCGYGIDDTINYGLANDMSMVRLDGLTLSLAGPRSQEELKNDLSAIPGIGELEGYTMSMSSISEPGGVGVSSRIYILGSETNSHMSLTIGNEDVAISKNIADKAGLKLGDPVDFTYLNVTYHSKVGQIIEAFVYNGVMIRGSNVALGDFSNTYQNAWVDIKEGYDPVSLKDDVYKALDYVQLVQTKEDWVASINDIVGGVKIMTGTVKVFAILLAAVVLFNLALMNFRDRTRDIATMKVLGFSRMEIASSLLWETMSLTFVGVLIGMAVGYPFMLAVLGLNQVSIVNFLYHVYPITFLISFGLTFVVAFVVNGGLALSTGRVKMVESLKSVE